MEKDEKRALFLSGAATMTVAELKEWAGEVKLGVWESIPQADTIDERTALMVSVFLPL